MSISLIVKLIGPVEVSSSIVRLAIFETVGASFTELTCRTNVSLVLRDPSLTATVIVVAPF